MDPAQEIETRAMARGAAAEAAAAAATAAGGSTVQQFYRGGVLLLTGGTGFMAKQALEKLFRVCDISRVYLLVRPKKSKCIEDRIKELLQDPCFDKVRKLKPDFADKIVPIKGDVSELRLGLSDHAWDTVVNEVDIIIHMAATTRFDESLRVATLINVRGTREILLLGRACTKLRSFVHVSTAYAQAVRSLTGQEIFEKFSESPYSPEKLIQMAEDLDDEKLLEYSKRLLVDYPNTYTYCKAVAEDLVRQMSAGLPLCIVRPGVVLAAYREPSPGWLDKSCAYGASGIIIGSGLGVLHTIHIKREKGLGVIPCDYVNNAVIVAGAAAARSRGGAAARIYTVTSANRNPLYCGNFFDHLQKNVSKLIMPAAVYCYFLLDFRCVFMYNLMTLFLHTIPAGIIDFGCLLLGKQRRALKISSKIHKMISALSYFTTNTWVFNDENLNGLQNTLSKVDKQIFNFDVTDIDWEEYLQIWVVGIRKYILNDGLVGTEKAAKRQTWYKILHYIITTAYIYVIYTVLSVLFSSCIGLFKYTFGYF